MVALGLIYYINRQRHASP